MFPFLDLNKERIADICKRHFVKSLYVSGSAVKGNASKNGDVDFLYETDIESFPQWATGNYDY